MNFQNLEYALSGEVHQHKGAARSIACYSNYIVSGGFDGLLYKNVVKNHKSEGQREVILEWKSLESQKSPIYSLTFAQDGSVFSGNQKGLIYRFTGPNPSKSYIGHSQTVNSLDIGADGVLISGSWDSTTRMWNAESGHCTGILSQNQSYAVTVCYVAPGMVVTGSQNKALNLWINKSLVHSVLDAHTDIIRGISLIPELNSVFISCANSGDVKFWRIDISGRKIIRIDIIGYPNGWLATENQAFLFDCRARLSKSRKELIGAVAADDGTARLFFCQLNVNSEGNLETISLIKSCSVWPHVSSVWGVEFLDRNDSEEWPDLVTACGDGVLRIFTPVPELAMPIEQINERQTEAVSLLKAAKATQEGESAVDISKLPSAQDRFNIRGSKVGKTMLFRSEDGNNVEVYSWSGLEWQKVGDMIAPPTSISEGLTSSTQHYKGDDFFPAGVYDHVFNVEIETRPGTRCLLPYRLTDNTLEVAERFCAREGISKHNVPDILNFIKQQTTDQAPHTPITSQPRNQFNSASPPQSASPSVQLSPLETMLPIVFKQGNKWQPAINKIYEAEAEQPPNLRLDALSKLCLSSLQEAMEKASFESLTLKNSDLQFIFGLEASWIKWSPKTALFPFFDIWRKLASHNSAADFFRRGGRGNQQVTFALDMIKDVKFTCAHPVPLCLLRWLANMSTWSSTRAFFTEHVEAFAQRFDDILGEDSILEEVLTAKATLVNTVAAFYSFFFNLAIGLNAEARVLKATSNSQKQALCSKIQRVISDMFLLNIACF
eukprot:Gregarina_sp_Poly_1__976@NODE_1238_length_4680_cov_68_056579_g843_i0_p1_GENE_NODE_1238_length_4680_cov_68_056579_g843_i0NODE_1238_length_4680_cov_68_056579_g843_i0_p1_ORF_typecomplete_len776_score80_24PFU/PF09070_11/5_2e20PUL/PF08324_11/2_8e12WD40/PF00400_32/61WD40/PF00400_32/1_1e02WD40/PF00400_32/2_9e05WD40/PF00400_32/6_5e02WD40/PF00400_32/1_2e02WD40/PF00400_32/1_5e03WD40/PF00400_32/39WD40_like/PF17005_5/0_0028WD40_like/PF17005_5/0_55Nup160/PF11715_8/0_00053ANAPC4_WD40/PF12894_7/36ANAPC4_WD40/P